MPTYDPNGNEWPLQMCKVKEAWELPLAINGRSKGDGVIIAHPDSGWTKHPELVKGGRYLIGPNISKNFFRRYPPNGTAEDPLIGQLKIPGPGHGTSTASLMLSDEGHPTLNPANNDYPNYTVPISIFVTGIAPMVRVLPLRVTNNVALVSGWVDGGFVNTMAALGKAIFYALTVPEIGVISISLGTPIITDLAAPVKSLNKALIQARRQGVIICAAAGQLLPEYSRLFKPIFPGNSPHTLCVAGCDKYFNQPLEGFYGPAVNITTPGWGLVVANTNGPPPRFEIDTNGHGTSYSTALTSGACALWLAYHGRDFLIGKYGRPFLFDIFKSCVLASSNQPLLGWDYLNRGQGVLDVEALLKFPLPTVADAEAYSNAMGWGPNDWGDPVKWGRIS